MMNCDVKWTNHGTEALATVAKFRDTERFADVSILCDDLCIPAHRVVLAACSSYFDRIFDQIDANDAHYGRTAIVLRALPSSLVRLAIEFIYSGEVLVPCDDLQAFMDVAEALELRGLNNASTADQTNTERVDPAPQGSDVVSSVLASLGAQRIGSLKGEAAEKVVNRTSPSPVEQQRREQPSMQPHQLELAGQYPVNGYWNQSTSDGTSGNAHLKRKNSGEGLLPSSAKRPLVIPVTSNAVGQSSSAPTEESTQNQVEPCAWNMNEENQGSPGDGSVIDDEDDDEEESSMLLAEIDGVFYVAEDDHEEEQQDTENASLGSPQENDVYPSEHLHNIPSGFEPVKKMSIYSWRGRKPGIEGRGNRGITYFCSICGYKNQAKSKVLRHERSHTKERPFKCPFCPKDFVDVSYLHTHTVKMHNTRLSSRTAALQNTAKISHASALPP